MLLVQSASTRLRNGGRAMKGIAVDAACFWAYSLRTYASPGVADACISLQDDHGCDVNVLLLCLWLAQMGQFVLEGKHIEVAQRSTAAVSEHYVQPVRSVRRWFKVWSEDAITAAPHAAAYAALKEAELHGERLVQSRLLAVLDLDDLARAGSAEAAAGLSFDNYCRTLCEPGNVRSQLGKLVAIAWQEPSMDRSVTCVRGT